jgi:hypothetical protein
MAPLIEPARDRSPARFDGLRYFFAIEFEEIGHTGPHAAIDALYAAAQGRFSVCCVLRWRRGCMGSGQNGCTSGPTWIFLT